MKRNGVLIFIKEIVVLRKISISGLYGIKMIAVINCKVHTVIFYLRKDITVGGGDFEYKKNGEKIIQKIESKSILQFCGNLSHRPQETWGFGCRDIIVVFIKRT